MDSHDARDQSELRDHLADIDDFVRPLRSFSFTRTPLLRHSVVLGDAICLTPRRRRR